MNSAEALAAAGLTHVRYAAGEEAPWDPGLFLLDVESGEVEAWVYSLAALSEEERSEAAFSSDDLAVSPSNRFVSWAAHWILYDRQAGRSYTVDRSRIEFDRWWGTGSGERLLFRLVSSGAFVVMDAELRPVARLELPPGERFTSANGGYILVRECVECEPGDRFHLVNLEDEANPEVHSWVLPWKTHTDKSGDAPYRIELLDDLVAFIADTHDTTCRVVRYNLSGTLLSDRTLQSWCYSPGGAASYAFPRSTLHRISPDGRLLAAARALWLPIASVFDAATGEEIVRIMGAYLPWPDREPSDLWLADSSGIVVDTHRSQNVATTDGTWKPAPGRPAPGDPDRFLSYHPLQVTNSAGDPLASLSFGEPSAPIPDPGDGAILIQDDVPGWGASGDTLRVQTTFFHVQHGWHRSEPPSLGPVIRLPPLEDRILVEVVVDTCLNLREDYSRDAAVLACLQDGTVAEAVWYVSGEWTYDPWFHIRTDDGLEGWASAEYLRWHSDGVRLEE